MPILMENIRYYRLESSRVCKYTDLFICFNPEKHIFPIVLTSIFYPI